MCTLATKLELLVAKREFNINIISTLAYSKTVCSEAIPRLYPQGSQMPIITIPFHIGRSYTTFGLSKEETNETESLKGHRYCNWQSILRDQSGITLHLYEDRYRALLQQMGTTRVLR